MVPGLIALEVKASEPRTVLRRNLHRLGQRLFQPIFVMCKPRQAKVLHHRVEEAPFIFFAKARRSKYDPIDMCIFIGEVGAVVDESETFPLVEVSHLSLKAQRYLRALEHTAENLPREREAL